MDSSKPTYGPLLAFAAGVASHLFYFRVGEHHMMPVPYFQIFILSTIAGVMALTNFGGAALLDAVATVSALAGLWLLGVYSSLITFRLFFHPLRNFPGPWQARLGDLWFSTQLSKADGYLQLTEYHRKLGPYVRIGSNTVSITDPDIMQPAYGSNSKVIKADWYDGSLPHTSVHTTRDRGRHDRRRRVWAPAFSDKALREYETVVSEFNEKFIQQIEKHDGKSVDSRTMFNLYAFDVMGRLAFGKDYGMLESGKRHWALDLLTEGLELSSARLPTWMVRFLLAIPGAAAGYYKFLNFCNDELRSRVLNSEKGKKDITSWLLKAYANEKHPEEDLMLQGDARLIIVAGSDTTSATLTFLFYYIASNAELQERLRNELRPLAMGDWGDKEIQHADLLNGAINEALRLHPPVPSGVFRKTPPEGLHVGKNFVPGNVVFFTPQYPMGREESIYTQAEKFVPERWSSKSEMVKHPDAFAPFSMGPFNCIGKNLARMELRTLTTRILLSYRVALAPGEDGSRILTKTKDHFTVSVAELDLTFSPIST